MSFNTSFVMAIIPPSSASAPLREANSQKSELVVISLGER
jgi:hypothetical protein